MKVFLKKVRLSFPALFEPESYEGSAAKFSATYIFPPDHPATKQIEAAMIEAAKDKWGEKGVATLKTLKAAGKVCLRDGDTKENLDGYPGNMFINASSARRVKIVDSDGQTPLVEADGKPYAGCLVNAYVEIWAMDNQFGKRICAGLGAVQFAAHGEPFGAGGGNEDFEPSDEEDDDDIPF